MDFFARLASCFGLRHWSVAGSGASAPVPRVLVRFLALLAAISAGVFLSACQPTPDERMGRAEAYVQENDHRSAVLELRNVIRVVPDNAEARLMLARSSFQIGDLGAAEAQYERVLGLGMDEPEVWLEYGRTMLQQGKAMTVFERVVPYIDSEPLTDNALELLGDVYSALGNSEEAAKYYSELLDRDSGSLEGLIGMGNLSALRGDHAQAASFLQQAVDKNPSAEKAWRARGDYFLSRKMPQEAVDAYEKSITLEGNAVPLLEKFSTRVNQIVAMLDAGQLDAATSKLVLLQDSYPPHSLTNYLRGRIAFEKGDMQTAEERMQEYLRQNPLDARSKALLGAINFSQNHLAQAELYLLQAVRANVGGEVVRKLLAETQIRLNKPEDAIAELQAIRRSGSSDPMLLEMLGRAEVGSGDVDAAIDYFEQSKAAEPNNTAVNFSLAAAYLQTGRIQDAIDILENLPDITDARYRKETLLIGAYIKAQKYQEAMAEGDKLLAAHPQDAVAISIAGVTYRSIGEDERAAELFKRALQLDSDNLVSLYSIAEISYLAGDSGAAIDYYGKLLDRFPTYLPALVSLAAVLQKENMLDAIGSRLLTAIEMNPGAIEPRVLMIRVDLAQGDFDAALEKIAATRQAFPRSPGLDNLEGKTLVLAGNNEQAIEKFARASAAEPDNAVYLLDLAEAKLTAGRFDDAERDLRRYREKRPADFSGLALAVQASAKLGRADDAREQINEFVNLQGASVSTTILAGDLELSLGQPAKALELYSRVPPEKHGSALVLQIARATRLSGGDAEAFLGDWLAQNSDDSEVRFFYAQLLEASGKKAQAFEQYESLLAAGELNAIGMNNLAWEYSLQGRPEALELARRASNLAPENGDVSDTLGWILFKNGNAKEAVDVLRTAVSQKPGDPQVSYHYAAALADTGRNQEAAAILAQILDGDAEFASREDARLLLDRL